MEQELNCLPPSMREKARWAREQIINNPKSAEIDEDELLAWVFNKENNCWYSISGNYSFKSPAEKMAKRQEIIKKQEEYEEKWVNQNIKEYEQWEYWSRVRKKILKRDKWTCQKCGQKIGRLEIHHIVKRKENRVDAEDNLITLCKPCHSKYDGKDYGIYER